MGIARPPSAPEERGPHPDLAGRAVGVAASFSARWPAPARWTAVCD